MNKIEIILMVIVVGYQVIRALKKRMEGPGDVALPSGAQDAPEDDWRDPEAFEADPTPGIPTEPAKIHVPIARPEVVIPLPVHRPVAAKSVRGEAKAVKSPPKRELLRQRLLGKVILDPPPGAAMLRRFKP